ncbi:hypothetical protein [Caulobacter sp. NIBR2454]|uniref:hypothetical protein n=1 Tax=Caulobacter sp. NIBR2454 TaxID=3015996 RepID=UPI0022B69E59|nr:hypothetical protein [Caulobacter sp. NIBR2454]
MIKRARCFQAQNPDRHQADDALSWLQPIITCGSAGGSMRMSMQGHRRFVADFAGQEGAWRT